MLALLDEIECQSTTTDAAVSILLPHLFFVRCSFFHARGLLSIFSSSRPSCGSVLLGHRTTGVRSLKSGDRRAILLLLAAAAAAAVAAYHTWQRTALRVAWNFTSSPKKAPSPSSSNISHQQGRTCGVDSPAVVGLVLLLSGTSGYSRRRAQQQCTKGRGCGRQIVVGRPSPIKNTSVFVMLLSSSACGLAAILGLAESAAAAAATQAAAVVLVEVPSVQRVHDALLTNSR